MQAVAQWLKDAAGFVFIMTLILGPIWLTERSYGPDGAMICAVIMFVAYVAHAYGKHMSD